MTAARSTGFGLIASNSVQEVPDFALIASAATLKTRVPFLHFYHGFRTSPEISKVELLADEYEYESLSQLHGSLNQAKCAELAA